MNDYASLPIDPGARAELEVRGLRLDLLDTADRERSRLWLLAEGRGFHEQTPSDHVLETQADTNLDDRVVGVWDDTLASPDTPVGTVRSWQTNLTVPGGGTVPAWAISGVTVAATHRRRGIARAVLTSELRATRDLGLPLAALTVSEATIYGRYGFGPAAYQAPYEIDTRRSRWIGPVPAGRVQFVSAESILADGPAVFERARLSSPGEIDRRDSWWKRTLALTGSEPDTKRRIRVVRYDDGGGIAEGFAIYEVTLVVDASPGRLTLIDLVAATDDAYAALWRFILEMDLVNVVSAPLRSVSEPLSWQIADGRAIRKTDQRDHLWLRILDVREALERRRFAAAGDYVLTVDDDLGFADGTYLLSVGADGSGVVRSVGEDAAEIPAGAAQVKLSVADLAAIYLGGSSAKDLTRAGRIIEKSPDAAARLDAAFRSERPPRLSIWF